MFSFSLCTTHFKMPSNLISYPFWPKTLKKIWPKVSECKEFVSYFYIIMIIAQGRCVQGWPRYYASELQPIGELGPSEGTLGGFFLTEILLITKTTTLSTLS